MFCQIRVPQTELEQIYKSALIEMHAAFAKFEEKIKENYSRLFDRLCDIRADDDLMTRYGEIFSNVVEERVESYHQQLKYMENNIRDFVEKSQKQLFKFKNFLVGMATLWEHHLASYELRENQFQDWFERTVYYSNRLPQYLVSFK